MARPPIGCMLKIYRKYLFNEQLEPKREWTSIFGYR